MASIEMMEGSETIQHNECILIADPRILAVAIIDNQEPLIDLKNQTEVIYGPSPEIPNNTDYTWLRRTVYQKIKEAQILLPDELQFCLYEAYRSIDLQKTLFDARYQNIKRLHPQWTQKQIFDHTTLLVSPVINADGSNNIPPHTTGGAIDIYLIKNGEPVEMGIHPKDWTKDLAGRLSATESIYISAEAKKNRKIMCDALSAVGFVNYPTEYWHWSYGDRYWAYHLKKPHALYGIINKRNFNAKC